MLEVPLSEAFLSIWYIERFDDILNTDVSFRDLCFGCTEEAGSSCTGRLT